MAAGTPDIVARFYHDDGRFPNNGSLPLIIFRSVLAGNPIDPRRFERLFSDNGWPAAWRNGLYDFHHYHSTAHEVLGIYRGRVTCRFGGPGGDLIEARAGDVVVIPAGVAHCNCNQTADFQTVGTYPSGQSPDMKTGRPGERPQTDANIVKVPLPASDPVFGADGPLIMHWSATF